MRALTVLPGVAGSAAVTDMPDPPAEDGPILVDTLCIGVCGTDLEITKGDYGTAPEGSERLIIGHESLGRVREAPEGSGFAAGDLVVGIVRRPDPVPCAFCAIGEWDMCQNGQYTERGINKRHGYASEQYRIDSTFAVKIDPSLGNLGVLLEPTTVVAKAWDHIERIGRRSAAWTGPRVLICGAGPIGLLAALLGVQRGHEVHVMDVATEGPKPKLVADMGATYHTDPAATLAPMADVVIECTGVPSVVVDVLGHTGPDAIVCLTGVSSGGRSLPFDAGEVNREMVLGNAVIFGSVNANRRHYEAGASALALADKDWLSRLISRRVPLEQFADALVRQPNDVKTVITIGES
jgi:threonine dehydrogenase-like Zn-dependent dehydrogenase